MDSLVLVWSGIFKLVHDIIKPWIWKTDLILLNHNYTFFKALKDLTLLILVILLVFNFQNGLINFDLLDLLNILDHIEKHYVNGDKDRID